MRPSKNCFRTRQYAALWWAITIDCTGVGASVLAGSSSIFVNVPGGTKVVLRGLDIQGLNTGLAGIYVTQGGILHVEKCVLHNFSGWGIYLASTNATELFVIDTSAIDSLTGGIGVQPSGGPTVNVVLDRVHVNNNNDNGVYVNGSSGATTRLQITNSTVSGNSGIGVLVQTGAQPTTVMVANSLVSGNGTGVLSSGSAAAVLLDGNKITNNVNALNAVSGGALFSYGNNAMNDNGSPGVAPTPVALR